MTTTIKEILELEVPALVEEYKRWATYQFERLTTTYGPTLKGAANSWHDGKFFSFFRGLLKREGGLFPSVSYDPTIPYVLNQAAVDKEAPKWAQEIATLWADKLEGKLGKDATGVECTRLSNTDYTFVAERQGRKLVVQQQRVYKVSSRGMPFYQVPARMYVDGQFLPEAKVKALFKASSI